MMNDYAFDSDEPVVSWPPGFVEKYDTLRAKVCKLVESPSATLTQRLNGKFCVTYTLKGQRYYGPPDADRLQAMRLFIDYANGAHEVGAPKWMYSSGGAQA